MIASEAAEKRFRPRLLRSSKKDFRRGFLNNDASLEERRAGRNLPCKGKVVRHDDHRAAFAREKLEKSLNFLNAFGVER